MLPFFPGNATASQIFGKKIILRFGEYGFFTKINLHFPTTYGRINPIRTEYLRSSSAIVLQRENKMIKIALIGFGVVGQGTATLLTENKNQIAERLHEEIEIKYILDLRDMPESPFADRIVHDFKTILADPEVTIIAEMIGGSHPAFDYSMQALEAGKHVVTSNKEVVANFGDKLLKKAAEKGVSYLFEASVGGGIPILHPLVTDLSANRILEISGILNGTTNYILTRMQKDNATFADALREAQKKGYAEANPAADIEGTDACRKIVILAALASGVLVSPDSVYKAGIENIRREDVAAAAGIGATVKLLGRYLHSAANDTFLMVSPFLIPRDCPIATVDDVNNGILVDGNFVGKVMFYGRGAGAAPTASAVVSDILRIAEGNDMKIPVFTPAEEGSITDIENFIAPRYLAVSDCDMTAIHVIFGGDIQVLSEDNEIIFITPPVSGRELSADIERIAACGGKLLSQIPVYQ